MYCFVYLSQDVRSSWRSCREELQTVKTTLREQVRDHSYMYRRLGNVHCTCSYI